MSARTDELAQAGMQFQPGVLPQMETLLDTLSPSDFNNLVTYTKQLSPEVGPFVGVALAYIAFQFRSGQA